MEYNRKEEIKRRTKKLKEKNVRKMLKIAHRGAMGHELENTVKAFKKSIELSVDMIELDVRKCKTGEPVVFHDPTVNRLTNGEGRIEEKTIQQIKKLKLRNGEKIPTLKEALKTINRETKVNIELKGSGTPEPVAKTIKKHIKEKGWKTKDFLSTSFKHHRLKKLNRHVSGIKKGLITIGTPHNLETPVENIDIGYILPHKEFITEEMIKDAHKKDLKIFTWTVNQKEEIEKFKEMNVDGIITDYPERI